MLIVKLAYIVTLLHNGHSNQFALNKRMIVFHVMKIMNAEMIIYVGINQQTIEKLIQKYAYLFIVSQMELSLGGIQTILSFQH